MLARVAAYVISVSERVPLADLEHQVRKRAARDGLVWLLAEPGGFRQLRRLKARLQASPVPGGDMAVVRAIDGTGGLLVVSSGPLTASATRWRSGRGRNRACPERRG